jgi:4-amino-4-deoxy-L-arabinose transferase-like glycosyltransferase
MRPSIEQLLPLLIVLPVLAYWSVSLSSNIIFGDEGFYAAQGRHMALTGEYPQWDPYISTAVYQNPLFRPPLYITLVSGLWLIGGELAVKLAIPLLAALTGLATYLLVRRMAGQVAGLAAGILLIGAAGFITYGVLNYVEVFNSLLIVLAVYVAAIGRQTKHWLAAGTLAGLAAITDVSGLFALPVIGVIVLANMRRNAIRPLLLIGAAAALVIAPWVLRSIVLFGSPCISPFFGCSPHALATITTDSYTFSGQVVQSGTGLGVTKMGWLNYFNFALGIPVLLLLLFGLTSLPRWRAAWPVLVPWLLIFVLLTFQQGTWGGRAEDIPRYTLFAFPAVAATGGLFFASAGKFLARWNRWLGLALVVILLLVLWPDLQSKLATMQQVKGFAPGFLQGCSWIEANTPATSRIFTIYQHHMSYACDRPGFSPGEVPDGAVISLSNNDTALEHLKLHGANYVMIAQFTVSQDALEETVTPAFINYLETSTHFKKVYDNTAQFGNSGIRLYQVL